jgi:hypothetical protein
MRMSTCMRGRTKQSSIGRTCFSHIKCSLRVWPQSVGPIGAFQCYQCSVFLIVAIALSSARPPGQVRIRPCSFRWAVVPNVACVTSGSRARVALWLRWFQLCHGTQEAVREISSRKADQGQRLQLEEQLADWEVASVPQGGDQVPGAQTVLVFVLGLSA